MRLVLSSALLGLMWFAAVNAAMTAASWMIGRAVIRRPGPFGADRLLTLRLLPAAVSSVLVLGVFLPAHWRFEPAESDESFGLVLSAVAAIGLFLIVAASWRALRAGLAGYRFAAVARRAAKLDSGAAFETFVLHGLPGVSLAGIWRPKILIGPEARAALTASELDLAISHEVAHRRSQDNLKRFLIFCSPDLFRRTAVARQIEERWQAETEYEADAHAVRGDGQRAVVLAAALVKVARLTCAGSLHPSPAWTSSAFHVPTLLERRVRRLVSGPALPPAAAWKVGWSSAALALGTAAGLWLLGFSNAFHTITEALVTRLP